MNGGTTADTSWEFLHRLATDDDFRAQLEEDPESVLSEYGLSLPEGLEPSDVRLPPADALVQVLAVFDPDVDLGSSLRPSPRPSGPYMSCLVMSIAFHAAARVAKAGAEE